MSDTYIHFILSFRNLQQAICSYFDLDAPRELGMEALPNMSFIKDVTIGEGEEVPPNTRFVKTWRIQNSGLSKHSKVLFCLVYHLYYFCFQARKNGHQAVLYGL